MKKVFSWIGLVLTVTLLFGCSAKPGGGGPVISFPGFSSSPTPLPTAVMQKTSVPNADAAMQVYLNALKIGDYASMYTMLAKASHDSITLEAFSKRYNDALNTMSAGTLDFDVIASKLSPAEAQVAFRIVYHTALVGDLSRDIVAEMLLEDGSWKVVWDDGLILPELKGGNNLVMEYDIPARGDIYDRTGKALVTQSEVFALGITPGQIDYKREGTLTYELSQLCHIYQQDILDLIATAGPDWYLPMCEGTKDEAERILALNPGGLTVTSYTSRYYFDSGLAPQAIGYTLSISKEQLDQYRRLGYNGSERVGQSGIEKWGEEYLAGKHGGTLRVAAADGHIITTLGQSPRQPADSIQLTIDSNLQLQAQRVIQNFAGAVVVLERDTGRVLAMASSPGFDPNLFEPQNPNNQALNQLLNDTNQPLVNHATQGQYPLGSVFKIITFSAGLESGLFLPETTYDCQYHFTELQQYGGPVLDDWTYEHCQDNIRAGKACTSTSSIPSGVLNYSEGLMRSCNPYFWHIGLSLYNHDRASDISNMARAFGLGAPSGIEQVAESSGTIEVPNNPIDATNQAIGQGHVLVTPLQVAAMVAAVGNGGTLYRPQLVEKITTVDGQSVLTFKPEARGTLPMRPDNLKLLQDAMTCVIACPRGTANFRLRGLTIPVAGKTGTAQSASIEPDAWFAGYTFDEASSHLPDIAIAVVLENQGQGSDYAAPIFRAMVETYYIGTPQAIPWFGKFGEPLYTPTPFGGVPTKTPRP